MPSIGLERADAEEMGWFCVVWTHIISSLKVVFVQVCGALVAEWGTPVCVTVPLKPPFPTAREEKKLVPYPAHER